MEKYFILWQLIWFIGFLSFIIKRYGIQDSISDSFRAMEKEYGEGSLKPYLFWLFLINISWPIWAIFLNGWAFFSMAGIVVVGAAATYWKDKLTERAHVVGATGGIALAFIALGFSYKKIVWLIPLAFYALPIYGITVLILKLKKVKNFTWWIETVAFIYIVALEILIKWR